MEGLFCCDSHGGGTVAHAEHEDSHDSKDAIADTNHAEADANHSHDAGGPAHDSHKHDGQEGSCCSTLKAVVQTAKPVVFSKPAFPPIPFLSVLWETRVTPLSLLENAPNRRTKPRDWIFTPGVCLGPAHRSLAPPPFA